MRDEVVADLEWVIEYWPDLVEARIPGTRRPWRQPTLSPEARAARDAQARVERFERTTLSLGESPAPVDVAILSTALDILVAADDLAAMVAEHASLPVLPPPGMGELDAWPYLAYAAAHLTEELVEHAAPIARWMVDQTARALCLVYDGQTLDVECPWCHEVGVWRVRELPGGLVAIVCHGVCEPPAREVGTWWGGQPVWPIQDWERLARHVQAAEKDVA
ncbi:hypothetical protein [Planomonospora venezuelensis]|uniref:Uncharacterized protein n=1 Tax=Planomonospora venezuelensis TaxID=1999 RepID=A0A841D6G1_PLAVE|nr:hypothetical protein [Planomonospora venezuelensis]MBB5965069.1 hypothetical protein [Planomonospora venezuelensis]GIN05014.1 hypothetical protein Pve01_66720 [Planomonospora venezuelensis]